MKGGKTISNWVADALLYGVCVTLICFFSFKPLIQLLSQSEGDDIELREELPSEDDTEDDTEDEKEIEDEWSENHFRLVSFPDADANFMQVFELQKDYFDSQHIEIPKQPPRFIL